VILAYLACFVACYVVPSLALRYVLHRRKSAELGTIGDKVDFYAAHAGQYDTVMLGDSRTYCDLSPELLDAQLGRRSINLAHWADWFYSQYPSFENIIAHLPKGTVVIWSIGHSNFQYKEDLLNYPIGARNVVRYLRWGYRPSSVFDNVIGLTPGLDVYAQRDALHHAVEQWLSPRIQFPPWAPQPAPQPVRNLDALKEVQDQHASDPHVLSIEVLRDGDEITSAGLRMDRGNYVRIEFDHAYFRRKQQELHAKLGPAFVGTYEPDQARWHNFLGLLDLFQRNGVRLIVNEVEEAPCNYYDLAERERLREFMFTVRAEVEARGFGYVRADWDRLSDEDYFDWNHLNSQGIAKYSALLAPLLAKELGH
jgi:hypothetical protein